MRAQVRNFLISSFLSLILVGCSETDTFGVGLQSRDGARQGTGRQAVDPFGRAGDRQSIISPGSDGFLGSSGQVPLVDSNGNRVSLNLVGVPVAEAADAVLEEALGLNYSIAPGVSGVVTLQTSRPVAKNELLEVFQSSLELTGATLSRSGDSVTIVPIGDATARVVLSGETAFGPRILAVPLQYISPAEMTRLLTPIIGGSVGIQAVPNRSVLLMSGSRDEVNAALEAVNLFDVDVLEGKSVAIFSLRSADPDAIASELDQIFDSQPGGALEGVLSFVPNQRLGAVLAISTRRSYIEDARTWVGRLDDTAGRNRRRPIVYPVENRTAEDLAPIMAELSGAASTDGGPASDGQLRVLADDARNAIVVWGNDQEQSDMTRLLSTLDTTPVQVMLEATIAEVNLTDELEFGVQWFFQNSDFITRLTNTAGGALNTGSAGLSFIFDSTNSSAVLSALNTVTDVEIVSSPSLLVLDNETATLQIGDEVPVATQTITDTDDTSSIVSTISFRDTGIILEVRPRVSSTGLVILEISQEVSSVNQTTSSGIDSPTISQRLIETNVQVVDGATIALGGLIQDQSTRSRNGVPVLQDIPILGNVFRTRGSNRQKTELLVLITPRVVRNGNEARQVSNEFRERLSGPNALVEGKPIETGGHRLLD